MVGDGKNVIRASWAVWASWNIGKASAHLLAAPKEPRLHDIIELRTWTLAVEHLYGVEPTHPWLAIEAQREVKVGGLARSDVG